MPKDFKYTGYNKNLRANSRALRKEMTPEEKTTMVSLFKKLPYQI